MAENGSKSLMERFIQHHNRVTNIFEPQVRRGKLENELNKEWRIIVKGDASTCMSMLRAGGRSGIARTKNIIQGVRGCLMDA